MPQLIQESNNRGISIRFLISKKEDKRILRLFSKEYDNEFLSGYNLFKRMIRGYEKELGRLNYNTPKQRDLIINSFIDKEYLEKKGLLINKRKRFIPSWKKYEPEFIKSTEKIFSFKFPKGDYKAYFTIFKLCPRDIELKRFQVRSDKGVHNFISIVIHELLHYMYFSYIDSNFKGQLGEDLEWDLSEILNVILLNREPYLPVIKSRPKPYPNHKNRFRELNKIYDNCGSMEEFVKKAIIYLKAAPRS